MNIQPLRQVKLAGLGLVATLGWAAATSRAASITLGTYTLLPNTPGQQIDVFVKGGDAVQGVDLEVMTGDGGADIGGAINAPKISDVNLFAEGSVFQNNNTGYLQNEPSSFDPQATESQFWQTATTVQSGSAQLGWAHHLELLAVLTIDTTGFTSGSFPLVLDNPAAPTNFPSIGGFGPTTPEITDGTIVISSPVLPPIRTNGESGGGFVGTGAQVPEPATVGLLAIALPAALLKRRRSPIAG